VSGSVGGVFLVRNEYVAHEIVLVTVTAYTVQVVVLHDLEIKKKRPEGRF